jgi:Ca-activated chloride channel family protein
MGYRSRFPLGLALACLTVTAVLAAQQPAGSGDQATPRFSSGVDLVNVTATVTDAAGRFVPNLRAEDFIVYDNDVPQTITNFSAQRVPVSLGVVLDTSGSMAGEKIDAATAALNRFLLELLDRDDEVFLYRFDDEPHLVQGWTTDRRQVSRSLERLPTHGGTAMYDTLAAALPLAAQGRHQKKALVIISDGNDTSSSVSARDVRNQIQALEMLVYAVGIDGTSIDDLRDPDERAKPWSPPPRIPMPGPRRRPGRLPRLLPQLQMQRSQPQDRRVIISDEHVNVDALRLLTDASGGRTEVVREPRDLTPVTTSISDELSRQYELGYQATVAHDGRWHSIRVELRRGNYIVRSRNGYNAN